MGKRFLGKVDYRGTGKRYKAYVEFELSPDGNFTMSGEIWNTKETDIVAGGQMVNELVKYFPHDTRLKRMVEIWQRYHLNEMHPGCEHQRTMGWETLKLDDTKETGWHIDTKTANLAMWAYPIGSPDNKFGGFEHEKGVLCKPCPVCGYKFGSAWRKEEIPEDVKAEIRAW